MKTLQECAKGAHLFTVVYSAGPEQDETVVRWCTVCGAIVIDKDYDGRTNPGAVMAIRGPSGYGIVDTSAVGNTPPKDVGEPPVIYVHPHPESCHTCSEKKCTGRFVYNKFAQDGRCSNWTPIGPE